MADWWESYMIYLMVLFSVILKIRNPEFKDMPLFDIEYLRNSIR